MNFRKPTTGDQRTASREAPVGASDGDRLSGHPIHGPGSTKAGRDRRCPDPNPPHVGETWRHLRTGREAKVIHRYADSVMTAMDGSCWPVDFFMQKWERA